MLTKEKVRHNYLNTYDTIQKEKNALMSKVNGWCASGCCREAKDALKNYTIMDKKGNAVIMNFVFRVLSELPELPEDSSIVKDMTAALPKRATEG